MILYDYSKESLLSSIVFSIISLICIICLAVFITLGVRTYVKNGWDHRLVKLSLAIVVSVVLSVFLLDQTFKMINRNAIYSSGKYETIVGPIEIGSITRRDYRDEELYSIDFVVAGVHFQNLVNSFSVEKKNELTKSDTDVEIRYSYVEEEMIIYQIVACIEQ